MSKIRIIPMIMAFVLVMPLMFSASASGQQPYIFLPLVEESATPRIDGYWTSSSEWKTGTETIQNYDDDTTLVIRAMRDLDNVYVLLEMPKDRVVDGTGGICFDTASDGGAYMNPDDHCYVRGTTLRAYQGDGRTTLMQQMPLDPDVLSERGLSGANSPYESDEHVTYEFKVPFDVIGEHDRYGFYVIYDTVGQSTNFTYYYSWPDSKNASFLRVNSPRAWGIITTSDQVVPEFPLPALGAIAGTVGLVAVITRSRFVKSFR